MAAALARKVVSPGERITSTKLDVTICTQKPAIVSDQDDDAHVSMTQPDDRELRDIHPLRPMSNGPDRSSCSSSPARW